MCVFFLCVNGVHIQNLSYRCHRIILQSLFSPSTMWGQRIEIRSHQVCRQGPLFTEISGQTYMTSNNSGNTVFPSMWVIWISPLWWVPCSPIPYSINIYSAFLRGDWLSFYNNKHPWNRLVFITPTELWV